LQQFLPPLAPDEPDRRLATRAATASTFVAGLELARNGTAELDQGEAFGAIHLAAADHQRALAREAVAA
jgi:segregation and condensation protein A